MKIQVNDFVKLVSGNRDNKMFKVIRSSENNLMMVNVDNSQELWSAHPDDVEIVKAFNLISEKLRSQ